MRTQSRHIKQLIHPSAVTHNNKGYTKI